MKLFIYFSCMYHCIIWLEMKPSLAFHPIHYFHLVMDLISHFPWLLIGDFPILTLLDWRKGKKSFIIYFPYQLGQIFLKSLRNLWKAMALLVWKDLIFFNLLKVYNETSSNKSVCLKMFSTHKILIKFG